MEACFDSSLQSGEQKNLSGAFRNLAITSEHPTLKVEIPDELKDLERRLREPPVIHNIGKKKKALLTSHFTSNDIAVTKRNLRKLVPTLKDMKVIDCFSS